MSSFQNIKGTFDVLPEAYEAGGFRIPASAEWRRAEATIAEVLRRYDFEEIRTPLLEPTELVARGVGGTTDIVQKEMFAFTKGTTDYVLRPEITAPVMRAYLQHRLEQRGGTQKLYYAGPCFRAEQPQRGRFRQFHQFGTETIGSEDPRADAEAIAAMMAVFGAFGITGTRLRLNTLGDADTRPRFREALHGFLAPHAGALSETSRRRLETNPLRVLDTKLPHEREILENAPRLIDFVDGPSREHYEEVKALLADLGIAFEEDPMLVRGLDYYTRTAFELESPDLGAQSALAGGGRYDGLAEQLGGPRVPAVGFAAGLERLFLALEAQGRDSAEASAPDAFFVALGEEAARQALRSAEALRAEGLHVGLDLGGRSFRAQMREANRRGARLAVIIGQDEIAAGQAQLRDMATGEQRPVPFDEIAAALHDPAAT